jgi:hypothetical protein
MGVSSRCVILVCLTALNTIARKPDHDKAIGLAMGLAIGPGDKVWRSGLYGGIAALNLRAGIAIVEG